MRTNRTIPSRYYCALVLLISNYWFEGHERGTGVYLFQPVSYYQFYAKDDKSLMHNLFILPLQSCSEANQPTRDCGNWSAIPEPLSVGPVQATCAIHRWKFINVLWPPPTSRFQILICLYEFQCAFCNLPLWEYWEYSLKINIFICVF